MTPGPRRDMIVIGASAGGVQALRQLFGSLPADLPATVAVVLHRSPFAESMLAEVLQRSSRLPVSEPKHAERLAKGRIYLAPRDHHLIVEDGRLLLSRGAKEHYTRPAVDPLFRSAAEAAGRRVIGVVLTGSGADGVIGLIAIKAAGGMSLVQDPAEAVHDSMPETAIEHDHIDGILTIRELAEELPRLVAGADLRPHHRRAAVVR